MLMEGILVLSKIEGTGGGRKIRGRPGRWYVLSTIRSSDLMYYSIRGVKLSGPHALFKD